MGIVGLPVVALKVRLTGIWVLGAGANTASTTSSHDLTPRGATPNDRERSRGDYATNCPCAQGRRKGKPRLTKTGQGVRKKESLAYYRVV